MPATRIWDSTSSTTFATAANWSADTAPVAGDTAIMPDGNTIGVAGFTPVYAQALAEFTTKPGYSGTLGSRTEGVISDLMIQATTVNLAGSGQAYVNLTTVTTCNVTGAAAGSPTTGDYGLALSGATITTLNIDLDNNQSVGVAALAGQTGTFTTINIGGKGTVVIGAGVTCTTLNVQGSGTVYQRASVANVNMTEGSPKLYLQNATAISTKLLILAGTVYEESSGTKATVAIHEPGYARCLPGSRTWTATTVYGLGGLDDSVKSVTFTNPIADYGLGTNVRLGSNKTIARGTI